MNCSKCQELLTEYSLGELDHDAGEQVALHLAGGCAACQRELNEIEESLTMLGSSLTPASVPPHIKQDLLARIRGEGKVTSQVAKQAVKNDSPATILFTAPLSAEAIRRRSVLQTALPYAAAVLIGFTVGALATQYVGKNGSSARSGQAHLEEILESARAKLGSPQVRFASLHPAEDENAVVGHLMWDALGRNLHFFAFDLERPAPGKALVVWFETINGAPLRAGELELSPRGACAAVFESPHVTDEITAVVVTEESDAAVTAPTGPQRIVAQFGASAQDAE